MGSPKAPRANTPAPPVQAISADTALAAKQAQLQEKRNRFSFDKTLLASNAATMPGITSTLG